MDLYTRLQRQQDEMALKITAQDLEISQLKARVKLLEDRDGGAIERSMEKGSNDTKEMVNVLTSMDVATVLSSGVSVSISPVTEVYVTRVPTGGVPTGSGSIPTASPLGTEFPTSGVPTGSCVVPTASPIFTTATVATPYTRRKEEEMERDAQRMNEQIARDAKIARIHAEEELQIIIDGLDRNNETIAKYLQEYYQFAAELPIGERIEMVKESERFKRKWIRLEQDSAKKLNTSEEISKEDLKNMMQLVTVEEVYVEALQKIRVLEESTKERLKIRVLEESTKERLVRVYVRTL
nr:hypothetical protein [Tanacetum cinerariifolium]